ncbi:MAG TPA: energy transducer TonB [Cellvibrionaceae bacterium]
MTPLPKSYWLTALIMAVLLHLIAATALLWQPAKENKGNAVQAGTGGVEISLGPAGGAPGGPEEVETEIKPNEALAEQQVVEDTTKASEPTEPEPEPVIEPEPIVEPEPVIEPEPTTKPEPVKEKKRHKKTEKNVKPATRGAGGKSGNKNKEQTGSGDNSAGGGLAGDTSDYLASLQAWLERHKQYPRLARRMRQEGTALLYFVVSPNGEVLNYELRQSSGHQHLDREVIAMIERAQPLPAMPASMAQKELELIIPVEFFLR